MLHVRIYTPTYISTHDHVEHAAFFPGRAWKILTCPPPPTTHIEYCQAWPQVVGQSSREANQFYLLLMSNTTSKVSLLG